MSIRCLGYSKVGGANIIKDDERGLHQFLQICKNQQHSLGLLESRRGYFTAHQFHGPTKQQYRQDKSPPISCREFSNSLFDWFVPWIIRDKLYDQLSILDQDPINVSEYEARFHEFYHHATIILSTEEIKVYFYVGCGTILGSTLSITFCFSRSFIS